MKLRNSRLVMSATPLLAVWFTASSAQAASATWLATPTDANWATGSNWDTAAAPGDLLGTNTNADTATFNATVTNGFGTTSPVVIDAGRNLKNITFSTAAASAYVIGTTGGNALLLSSGGTIQTVSGVVNVQTVNAPLVLQPASATTAGTYTFSSNAASATHVLNFGGAISTGVTTSTQTLTLTGTNTGANTLSGTLSGTNAASGLILNKTGAGAWTLGGNGSSTLAKGKITANGGTFNFGSATEAPTLTISAAVSGDQTGLSVDAGDFNMKAGNLTANNMAYGLLLNNTSTYTQTGGTFSTNAVIGLANNGGSSVSTVNISGGSFTTTNGTVSATELAVRGTTTFNLSGTGTVTTPTLNMSTSQIGSGAATSTFNLDGGTLVAGKIIKGTGGSTGTQTFNFNGGTLKSSASSTTYMTGLTNAFVKAGGAVIDTQAFNVTIGQNLLTDVVSTGGGLTKQGAGTLTLTGANTYTGATTISGGMLSVSSLANGGSTSGIGASGAAAANLVINGGTLQYSGAVAASTDRSFTVGTTGATIDASGTGAGTLTIAGSTTLATNAATTTLNLSGSHTGANTFSGTLSSTNAADGLILNKAGAGAWTLGGNGSSTLAKGRLTVSDGTFNFGSATEAPTLTINAQAGADNSGMNVNGGTFIMKAGNLSVNNMAYGLLLNNNSTYTQTGGAYSTNAIIGLANNGGNSTVNISGGSFTTTYGGVSATELAVRGTTIFNLSGTGTVTTPTLNMSTSQIGSGAATSTFNLDGGTLVAGKIIKGTGGSTGTQTFNFNGGTLKSSASSTTYMTGLTNAFVKAGGAVIDTQAFNVTIGQNLLTDVVSTGGGLTKQGSGTLTISGTNTYTGATLISGGTLRLDATGTINNTSEVSLGTVGTFDVSAKGLGYTVGTLKGSGNVTGALTVSTQLAIGNSPGTTNFSSSLTLGAASTYVHELTSGATPGLNSADLGDIAGALTISAGSILDLVQLGAYTAGNKFTLFAYDGLLTGTFKDTSSNVLADGATFTDAGGIWMIDYNDTTAGANGGVSASNTFVTITAVPEPNVAALLGGLGMLALLRRRR